MNGLNTCAISGNLTRDPEYRTTGGGMGVLSFTVAVNSSRKNRQTGEYEDYPNFIDCTMFGKRADGIQRYLSKGTYAQRSRWSRTRSTSRTGGSARRSRMCTTRTARSREPPRSGGALPLGKSLTTAKNRCII